jgi:uncharacterized Zn finger protein
MSFYDIFGKRPSVSELKAKAEKLADKLRKTGTIQPVLIEGKQIATTFWGRSWCTNIESYEDFAYRLDRGRAYVRHGAVVDLQMREGKISAQVSGSSLYKVHIEVEALPAERWVSLQRACAGKIGSLMELLQGRLSKGVMEVLCRRPDGIFPAPGEIKFRCSCPDAASMCKHVAAVMYGVGNRLDTDPSILFLLRSVKKEELISEASIDSLLGDAQQEKIIGGDLSSIFGVDFVDTAEKFVRPKAQSKAQPRVANPAKKKASAPRAAKEAKRPATKPKRKATAKSTKTKQRASPGKKSAKKLK